MYKGMPIKLSADFSVETLQARREWPNMVKVIKGKKSTTKNTLPSKAFIQKWEKFTEKEKLREFSTTKPVL